jgi:hypothetical protein
MSPKTWISMWRGRGQVSLEQHPIVAESGFRFALRRGERCGEVGRALDDLHALAAAAGRSLDQHRKADPFGFARKEPRILVVAVIAGHQRHAGLAHDRLRRRLRAHRGDGRGRRPDEDDACGRARRGKLLVLRKEAVARVDRLRAALAAIARIAAPFR